MADAYVTCTNDVDVESLFRLLCVDSDGDAYIDCTNDEFSIEDLIKLIVVEDTDGNPAIAVTLGGVLKLTPLAAAPATPAEGWVYVNSVTHHIYCYLNGGWVQLDN